MPFENSFKLRNYAFLLHQTLSFRRHPAGKQTYPRFIPQGSTAAVANQQRGCTSPLIRVHVLLLLEQPHKPQAIGIIE